MTINFYQKNGDIIYCYIRGISKGKEIILNTKMRIDPIYWNSDKQVAKRSYSEFIEFNRYLDNYKIKIENSLRVILLKEGITFESLKQQLIESLSLKKSNEILKYIDQMVDEKKDIYAKNTIKKYISLKNHLENFADAYQYSLTFENMNLNFLNQFQKYSIDVLKLNNNSFNKYITFLKTIINYCNDIEVTNINYTRSFKLKNYNIEIITLTKDELTKLEEVDVSKKEHLQNIKDVFLFSIYTGQRFSDISNVKAKDIDLNNEVWNLRTTKTKDNLKIPLSERAIEIAKKYIFNADFLPTISSQKTNDHLKTLGRLSGIDIPVTLTSYIGNKRTDITKPKYELITSHTARRTFVTLSLINGMKPNILMKITGHKDLKTLNKYIRIDNNETQKELKNIWNIKSA